MARRWPRCWSPPWRRVERGCALTSQILRYRVGFKWYAVVLLGYPLVYLAGVGLYLALSGDQPSFRPQVLWQIPLILITSLPFGPLGEELGWRGFALPRLLRAHGAVRASLILGALWLLWHFPAIFVPGMALPAIPVTWEVLLNYALSVMAMAFLFTLVYQGTGGSALMTILLHTAINSTRAIINPFFWGKANASQITGMNSTAAAVTWLVVLAILVRTKGALGAR